MLKNVVVMVTACLLALPVMGWAEEGFTVSGEIEFGKNGMIYIQLVTEEQFKNAQKGRTRLAIAFGEEEQKAGKVSFRFENVSAGTYALTAFQDEDGDGRLTSGTFGPKEPWGTYQYHRPKFSPPKFEKMAFEVKENTAGISVTLK